jgi:hypothetical protein
MIIRDLLHRDQGAKKASNVVGEKKLFRNINYLILKNKHELFLMATTSRVGGYKILPFIYNNLYVN